MPNAVELLWAELLGRLHCVCDASAKQIERAISRTFGVTTIQLLSSQVPEGSGEQGKKEETGCKIICGAPTTLAVKGLMMMMMMMMMMTIQHA